MADLAAFAEKRGITFPLLSDEGSHTIRRLGLLNEHIEAQHAFYGVQVQPYYYGIPYPGVFVLDGDGVITEKRFELSYRVRLSPVVVLEEAFGGRSSRAGLTARAQGPHLAVEGRLDAPIYHIYERHRLTVELQLAAGVHAYGEPVPDGYVPLTIEVEPVAGLILGPLTLPPTRPFRVQGLPEDFHVYAGRVLAQLPLHVEQLHEQLTLVVRVGYQACTDRECFPPAEVRLELPCRGVDLVRD